MITEKPVPFVARFAHALTPNDDTRQTAQLPPDEKPRGHWNAPRTAGMTRYTKVDNETTDDE